MSDTAASPRPETAVPDGGYRLSPQQAALFARFPDVVPALRLVLRVPSGLDPDELAARWRRLVAETEVLRLVCRRPAWSRQPLQAADPEAVGRMEILTGGAAERAALLERSAAPLDPGAAPPVEAVLLHGEDGDRLVLRGGPHAVDGESLLALARGLLGAGTDPDALPFLDVAEWAAELPEDPEAAPGLAHWRTTAEHCARAPRPLAPLLETRAAGARVAVPLPWPELWETAPPSGDEALALAGLFAARLAGEAGVPVALRSDGRDLDDLAGVIGPLARWLPVVLRATLSESFAAWCEAAAVASKPALEWQHLAEAGLADAPSPVVGLDVSDGEDIPGGVELRDPEAAAPPLVLRLESAVRRLTLLADPRLAETADAHRLARLFGNLAAAARARPAMPAARLDWLDDDLARRLRAEGEGASLAARPGLVPLRIAEMPRTRPDAPALACDGERLSYAELWDLAAGVAVTLPPGGPDDARPVAVRLPRGTAAVAAMLGAWRAGRPYVPCDPALPPERLAEMLKTADPVAEIARLPETRGSAPDPSVDGADLAYLLFTSGSTGTPKGVAVTHAGLAASTAARSRHYGGDPTRFLVVSPLGFDSSVAGLYWTLATGGCLHLPSDAQAGDAQALAALIGRESITHTLMLPGLWDAVLEAAPPGQLDSLQLVVVAGEACPSTLVERHRARLPGARLENEYGPTEATVWCTAERLDTLSEGRVAIGRAIPGSSVQILDAGLQPLPPGVPGEICVAGPGLARGYLGRPAETAARFRPDPGGHAPGARLYRTGDRGTRLADGRILFQGRLDTQVKLRGYRVELEEIEAALRADARLAAAAVAVHEGRLVGYLVPIGDTKDLYAHVSEGLAARLPDWMVPQAWVTLPALPLGATGKLDRARLPAPQPEAEAAGTGRPPRDAAERAVAEIWGELLKIPAPGIDADFFRLGGDSLLALRAATRMRQLGIEASPRLLLQHPTIAGLLEAAPRRAVPEARAEAGPSGSAGVAPLTPIQRWLLDRAGGLPRRYNQALRVAAREPLDLTLLEQALAAVAGRHPALSLRFAEDDGGWRQSAGSPQLDPPQLYDVRVVPEAARTAIETSAWESLHGGLDPAAGRHLRAALLRGGAGCGAGEGAGEGDLLMLAAHHLAVDAVSWRVLLDDLELAYRALQAGRAPAWEAPAGSFLAWAEAVAGLPEERLAPEHWRAQAGKAAALPPLPCDATVGDNLEGETAQVAVSLPPETSELLATRAPGHFAAGLDDLLTAALAETLAAWQGCREVRIDSERHGRNDALLGLGSETCVGWFTTLHPQVLSVPEAAPAVRRRALLDQLAATPEEGFGYGVLRWRDGALPAHGEGEVLFNFLGRTDRMATPDALFAAAPGPEGRTRDPALPRPCLLEIDAEIVAGRLEVRWHYAATRHARPTVERLAADHLGRIAELAAEAAA